MSTVKRHGNHKYDPKFCQLVIDIGERGGSLAEMAQECGVLRDTMMIWAKEIEPFGRAIQIAKQAAQVVWEKKGLDATFGKTPGFNATSYIFNMKNRFGHDYSDVSRVDVNSTVNHNLQLDSLTQDQLAQLASMLAPKSAEPLVIEGEVLDE